MKRRNFMKAAGAAGGAVSLSGCRSFPRIGKRPNVVLVLTDQWRASATGYAGDPNVETPHLDALAAEGVNFRNAVSCCPVCSPARGSLITGQYPLKHGVFLNDVLLQHKSLSIADVFNQAGYRTGYIGKWHLDGQGRSTYIPPERRQGFQYWKALECSHNYNNSAYYENDDPEIKYWDGYDVFAQTDDAINFMRTSGDQPFFLILSWGPPHDPYLTAPEEFMQRYDPASMDLSPNVPEDEAAFMTRTQWEEKASTLAQTPALVAAGYYAHCTAMDRDIGRLRKAIRESGLGDDTIFIFTSDHGDMLGSHGQWNKMQPYDESVRVPFLIEGPGVAGGTVETPINTPDIYPTLCGLCGIPVPDSVEGRNYTPELRSGNWSDEAALIANYHAFGQWSPAKGGKEWRGVRTARHTYAEDLNGPWLLFDNERDPYQQDNLVNRPEFAALQVRLKAALQKKLHATRDEFRPGMDYVRKWGYSVDETGTAKYSK